MAYNRLNQKIANDVLGPGTLNAMRANVTTIQNMFAGEHNQSTGEHNAYDIPRVVHRITTGGAESPGTSDITAVTNPSTGRYVLTLASGRFDAGMQVSVNVVPEVGVVKPYIATAYVVSATSIEVFIKRLSSTLGSAGNTWAAVNMAFDIAIYSRPLYAEWTVSGMPREWGRNSSLNGYGLVGGGSNTTPSSWSLLVRHAAQMQAKLTTEHSSAGAHNTRQVATAAGRIIYQDAGTPKYDPDGASTELSEITVYGRTSTGVCTLTHAAWTAPINSFVCVDYERNIGGSIAPYVINAVDTSTTVTTVWMFKWDAANAWWIADDCDFWIALHK